MARELGRTAVAALGLPRDVMLGDVLIRFVGYYEVVIENYRNILLYTDTLIRIQAKNCRLLFQGTGLCVEYYTAEEMKITGCIASLSFEKTEER